MIGILRFPGTNCDQETFDAVKTFGRDAVWLWHEERFDYKNYKGFIIPGGFSFGDYLRTGVMAARSPAMNDLRVAAENGWPVLGICNGFQILCEAGLLPGVLMRNSKLRFIDKWVSLKLNRTQSSWYKGTNNIKLPIAHGE